MRFQSALIASLVLLGAAAAIAQTGKTIDQVTGTWGSDGLTYLDLKFDGKRSVSGSVTWRAGRGKYEYRAPIKAGTFDTKTAALKLEGKGKKPDGAVAAYVIEGRIEKDTVTGTYQFGDERGDFKFTRR